MSPVFQAWERGGQERERVESKVKRGGGSSTAPLCASSEGAASRACRRRGDALLLRAYAVGSVQTVLPVDLL